MSEHQATGHPQMNGRGDEGEAGQAQGAEHGGSPRPPQGQGGVAGAGANVGGAAPGAAGSGGMPGAGMPGYAAPSMAAPGGQPVYPPGAGGGWNGIPPHGETMSPAAQGVGSGGGSPGGYGAAPSMTGGAPPTGAQQGNGYGYAPMQGGQSQHQGPYAAVAPMAGDPHGGYGPVPGMVGGAPAPGAYPGYGYPPGYGGQPQYHDNHYAAAAPMGGYPGANPGHARGPGMAEMMEEIANGGNGLSSLGRMLDFDDKDFWKGALLGAAVVLLLTNETVQNTLFRTTAKAKEKVKSGVDKMREKVHQATEKKEPGSTAEQEGSK